MTKILQITGFAGLVGVVFMIFISGLEKSEIAECATLQSQAVQYADKGFYVIDWQRDMCAHHNMPIVINNK